MHSSSKLSFPSQFSNQTNNTQKKIHTENTQSWVELRSHPSKRQTKTTTKPRTFSYFLSSSHQTKKEHNPRLSNQKKKRLIKHAKDLEFPSKFLVKKWGTRAPESDTLAGKWGFLAGKWRNSEQQSRDLE